jgi:hypothetical protein
MLNDMRRISEVVEKRACIYSEMSALVAVHTQRVAYPSLWNSLEDINGLKIPCEYYYMQPGSLRETSLDDINRFTNDHEEIFRSAEPGDKDGGLPLGVLVRFQRTQED